MRTKNNAVYISHLTGLPVIDSIGDALGRVRDVVCYLRRGKLAPHVRGLVVELTTRARIFIPMARIHSMTVEHVSIRGQVDMRRFIKREAEVLVAEDLLDAPVGTDTATRIMDVSMLQTRNREWELFEVALRTKVGVGRFGLGGKNTTWVAPWHEIPQLVLQGGGLRRTAAHVVADFAEMKPADVAQELHDMEPKRRADIVNALDDETLAEAIEELPDADAVQIISTLDNERAATVLEEMDPDDAAALIRELPHLVAEELLDRMEPDEALDVRRLLQYDETTAGGMMTPEPVIVGTDATVADALALCREESLTPALASMVFVCRPPLDTPSGRYVGAAHIQRLLRTAPTLPVVNLLDESLEPLQADASVQRVSRFFATYNLVVAPVVSENNQLLGAVTVDDVLDHMLPEDWRSDQMAGEDPEVTNA